MDRIIFHNPLVNNQSAITLAEIITMIKTSENLLRIAMAYFTSKDIAIALEERTRAGKLTRILLNTADILRPINNLESEIVISKNLMGLLKIGNPLEIQTLGYKIVGDYHTMHHKFMVSEDKVIYGTLNWTHSALNNNHELVVISDNVATIDQFITEFDSIWKQSERFYSPNGKVRVIMCPICKASDGVDFESYGPICTFCKYKFKQY